MARGEGPSGVSLEESFMAFCAPGALLFPGV